jgi:hypothetical protein
MNFVILMDDIRPLKANAQNFIQAAINDER